LRLLSAGFRRGCGIRGEGGPGSNSAYNIGMTVGSRIVEDGEEVDLPSSFSRFGLVWRGKYKWAEACDTPIRRIFQIRYLKGNTAVLSWGLSLSFLPVLQGSRLVYHRTARSARLDVREEPRDFRASFSSPTRFEYINCSEEFFRSSFAKYLIRITPEAVGWFERVRSLEDVEHELERQALNKDWAYRIRSPKPAFVLAFVKASRGDLKTAEQLLLRSVPEGIDPDMLAGLKLSLTRTASQCGSKALTRLS